LLPSKAKQFDRRSAELAAAAPVYSSPEWRALIASIIEARGQ
jgi:hypothetical protein